MWKAAVNWRNMLQHKRASECDIIMVMKSESGDVLAADGFLFILGGKPNLVEGEG